jgi:hypothetical protein
VTSVCRYEPGVHLRHRQASATGRGHLLTATTSSKRLTRRSTRSAGASARPP